MLFCFPPQYQKQKIFLLFLRVVITLFTLLSGSESFADCVGVVTSGGGNSFWARVEAGAQQAGKDLGLEIYFRGPIDEGDIEAQAIIINWIEKHACIGLVLAPNSPQRIEQVANLKQHGIPTVYIDRDYGGDRVSVIKTENFKAGILAGHELARALGNKGRVAVLRMKKGVVSTDDRENGFIKGATDRGLVVSVDEYLATSISDARDKAYRTLKSVTDLDGIFTPNESTTLAVLGARKQITHLKNVKHIGFDAHSYMVNAVKDGVMLGFVVQNPYEMGYQGVQTIQKIVTGDKVEEIVDTGVLFVNANNINEKPVKDLIGIE